MPSAYPFLKSPEESNVESIEDILNHHLECFDDLSSLNRFFLIKSISVVVLIRACCWKLFLQNNKSGATFIRNTIEYVKSGSMGTIWK
mgnify:CR=1 FL=1